MFDDAGALLGRAQNGQKSLPVAVQAAPDLGDYLGNPEAPFGRERGETRHWPIEISPLVRRRHPRVQHDSRLLSRGPLDQDGARRQLARWNG